VKLEADVLAELTQIGRIDTHIEPEHPHVDTAEILPDNRELVEAVRNTAMQIDGVLGCHDIAVRKVGEVITLRLHCSVQKDVPIAEAHWLSSELERNLSTEIAGVDRVLVHLDPA
jgi:ferrous-iron efflux pump FieF